MRQADQEPAEHGYTGARETRQQRKSLRSPNGQCLPGVEVRQRVPPIVTNRPWSGFGGKTAKASLGTTRGGRYRHQNKHVRSERRQHLRQRIRPPCPDLSS